MNINEYYKKVLEGKDTNIKDIKSWKLIKEKNKSNLDLFALSEENKKITFGEMFEKWNTFARAFSSLGVTRENNSRVLVLMPNVADTCYINYALDMTGAVCDFVDPTTSYEKVRKYIENEKITDIASLDLMCSKNFSRKYKELKEEMKIKNLIVCHSNFMNSMFPKFIKLYSNMINVENRLSKNILRLEDIIKDSKNESIIYDTKDSRELSLITHTSGTTTGMGKPIPLTDYNRNALVKQYELAKFNYRPGMKMLHFIPYFASYGSVNTTHLGLAEGMELEEIPLFSPDKFAEILLKYKPNIVLANTPCWLNLIKSPLALNADLSFLTYASSGGMNTSNEDEMKINDFLHNHNSKIVLRIISRNANDVFDYDFFKRMDWIENVESLNFNSRENIIDSVRKYLSHDEYLFWSTFEYLRINNKVHFNDVINIYGNLKKNVYSKALSYNKLKRNLKNAKITYYDSDIMDIEKNVNKKYDRVFLSNVLEYVLATNTPHFVDNYQKVISGLDKILLPGSVIYGYDFSNVSKYSDNISEHLSYKYDDVSCKSCGVQQKIFSLSKV